MKAIYSIAASKEHWSAPFTYKLPPIPEKEAVYAKLSTREKVIAVGFAIITAPIAPITFILITAYFKHRALKKIQEKPKFQEKILDGFNIRGNCPTTNREDVFANLGFGEFNWGRDMHRGICECCNKKINGTVDLFFKNCKYSMYGQKIVEGHQKPIAEIRNVEVKQLEQFDFQQPWLFLEFKVQPLAVD